jgi:NitT/TauT family transport system substrate-binding protein
MNRALIAGALMFGFAGTAGAQDLQHVNFALNYLVGGPSTGFIYAKKLGLYEKEGLDVSIQEGRGSSTTAQLVATGSADIGYAESSSVMQVKAKGAPITMFSVIYPINSMAIIALKDGPIKTSADIKGKRIGVTLGTSQAVLLDPILKSVGLTKDDVTLVNIDSSAMAPVLLQDKVDAILGGATVHSNLVRNAGKEVNEMLYADLGVNLVGLTLIARDDRLKASPDLFKKFADASIKGWAAARDNPEAAADAVVEAFPVVKRDGLLKEFKTAARFLCGGGSPRMGMATDANWQQTWTLMTQYLSLPTELPATAYYSQDYTPKEAAECKS